MALTPIRFAGEVRCVREEGRALCFVLRGAEALARAGARAVTLEAAFAMRDPPWDLEGLRDAVVEELCPERDAHSDGLRRFLIRDARQRCTIEALSVHVHRDVRDIFFAAVPPRRAPPARRIFFALVPALVANPLGRWLLRALRRR